MRTFKRVGDKIVTPGCELSFAEAESIYKIICEEKAKQYIAYVLINKYSYIFGELIPYKELEKITDEIYNDYREVNIGEFNLLNNVIEDYINWYKRN